MKSKTVYHRIPKTRARKYYNSGLKIILLPCKVSESILTDHTWLKPTEISIFDCEYYTHKFDRTVSEYIYYNCNNTQVGKYPHYYISEEELAKYEMCKMMCNEEEL